MISAKLMTIQVPFLLKDAIDLLAAPAAVQSGVEAVQTASYGPLLLTPAALMIAYGVARTSAEGMTQLRNALFARISEGALRRMSVRTFRHLHSMELRFHLSRQTGALSRTVERGTRAVGTLLSTSVLHVLPTVFEVGVVSALLARHCDPAVAATTLVTLGAYAAFTFAVTARRTLIRKQQNQAENAAAQVFTDSNPNPNPNSNPTLALSRYGFLDGKTELEVNRYRECELTHGRVGMLAAVGFIVQERAQTPDKIRYDRAYCLRAPTVHPRFLLRWLFFSTYEGSAYHGSTYRVA